jgi:hypothetical protein
MLSGRRCAVNWIGPPFAIRLIATRHTPFAYTGKANHFIARVMFLKKRGVSGWNEGTLRKAAGIKFGVLQCLLRAVAQAQSSKHRE